MAIVANTLTPPPGGPRTDTVSSPTATASYGGTFPQAVVITDGVHRMQLQQRGWLYWCDANPSVLNGAAGAGSNDYWSCCHLGRQAVYHPSSPDAPGY